MSGIPILTYSYSESNHQDLDSKFEIGLAVSLPVIQIVRTAIFLENRIFFQIILAMFDIMNLKFTLSLIHVYYY